VQNVIDLAKSAPAAEVKKNSDSEQSAVSSRPPSVASKPFTPVAEKKVVEPTPAAAISKPEPVSVTTTVAEPPVPIEKSKKSLRIEGSTSLADLQNQLEEKEKNVVVADSLFQAHQEIEDNVLKDVWGKYALQVTTEKPHITSLFRSNQPVSVDGAIKVVVNTLVQKNMFDEELPLFVEFVKKEKNLSIHVIVEVNKEPDATPKRAFTQKEKLDMMIEKNPHVLTLLKQFELK
jgi:hypothetical protein